MEIPRTSFLIDPALEFIYVPTMQGFLFNKNTLA